MSFYDYNISREIASNDYPFYSLIMAAMRGADTHNVMLLKQVFPVIHHELVERYNAPGGRLSNEVSNE